MRPVVFLGPTLPRREAQGLLDAAIRPPAGRGDVYRALRDGFDTIVLIDGEFHGRPSVWQREIADAIAEGATVHGAASMGALRAAELHGFGMIGHGRIFEQYRDGALVADDEVALVHAPEDMGYLPLSEPLVNIRATLAAAVPQILSAAERDRLIEQARACYFPDRCFAAVVDAAREADRPALSRFVADHRIDQKRLDAIAALSAVPAHAGAPAPARNGPPSAWWLRHRLVAEGVAATTRGLDAAAIAGRAGLTTAELDALRRRLSARFFLGHAETDADDPAREQAAILAWAEAHGIERRGLSGAGLAAWIVEAGPNHFGYAGWQFEVELVKVLRQAGRLIQAPEAAA